MTVADGLNERGRDQRFNHDGGIGSGRGQDAGILE